jgi:hypothetical protein
MFDLKGSSGAMPLQQQHGAAPAPSLTGALAHVPTVTTWGGATTTIAAEPVPQSAFVRALHAEVRARMCVFGGGGREAGGGAGDALCTLPSGLTGTTENPTFPIPVRGSVGLVPVEKRGLRFAVGYEQRRQPLECVRRAANRAHTAAAALSTESPGCPSAVRARVSVARR